MKRVYLLLISVLLCAQGAMADHVTSNLFLASKLSGAEEVPAVNTPARGLASYVFNEDRTELMVRAHAVDLTGPITGAHLHLGMPGQTGPVVFDLTPGIRGGVIRHRIMGITRQQAAQLLMGMYYINVHTAMHPNGEIRGQVMQEKDISFVAEMTGDQEVPPVATQARGLAIFNLSQDKTSVEFFGVITGMNTTGIHLHMAPRGVAGPVVVDLGSFLMNGNTVLRGRVAATPALASAMMNDSIYLNAHSAMHPNGEVRGQLVHRQALYFDSRMTGAQEVPPVATQAAGLTVMMLTPTMDTLHLMGIISDSLSGPVTGAHIHEGGVGVAGPVVVSLVPFLRGNRMMGRLDGTDLTNDLINSMLSGNNYVNVHTTANPNGEIRGQIYKTMREGFTFMLDGSQQVPPVATPGKGFAFLGYDRDMTSLHYAVNWDSTTGNVTGAHFHTAMPGQTGPVVFDITPTIMGKMTAGYWNQTSAPAFSPVWARRLRRDSMYVNLHTPMHPNGELRGQTLRALVATKPALTRDAALQLAPNPATASFEALGITEETTLTVQTVTGAQVLEARVQPGQRISAGTLAPGLYIYQLRTRKSQNTGKLIKQ